MKANFVCFTTAHLYCIIIENLQTNYLTKHVFFSPCSSYFQPNYYYFTKLHFKLSWCILKHYN